MNLITLFTTFSGRINRKQWWIGFAVVLLIQIALIAWLDPDYFLDENPDVTPSLANFLIALLFLVPATAITVKRFNDRSYPWWVGYAIGVLSAIYSVADYAGYFSGAPENFPLPQAIVFWAFAAIGLFFLVDNGFMRGIRGPNRYGPDPNIDAEFDAA